MNELVKKGMVHCNRDDSDCSYFSLRRPCLGYLDYLELMVVKSVLAKYEECHNCFDDIHIRATDFQEKIDYELIFFLSIT